jgi:hypothetical protein
VRQDVSPWALRPRFPGGYRQARQESRKDRRDRCIGTTTPLRETRRCRTQENLLRHPLRSSFALRPSLFARSPREVFLHSTLSHVQHTPFVQEFLRTPFPLQICICTNPLYTNPTPRRASILTDDPICNRRLHSHSLGWSLHRTRPSRKLSGTGSANGHAQS